MGYLKLTNHYEMPTQHLAPGLILDIPKTFFLLCNSSRVFRRLGADANVTV